MSDQKSSPALSVLCIWHNGNVDISDAYQNGKKWKCRSCYGTERWLQKNYAQNNKKHIWNNMSFEERAKEIAKNVGNHGSQGQKRTFRVSAPRLHTYCTCMFWFFDLRLNSIFLTGQLSQSLSQSVRLDFSKAVRVFLICLRKVLKLTILWVRAPRRPTWTCESSRSLLMSH